MYARKKGFCSTGRCCVDKSRGVCFLRPAKEVEAKGTYLESDSCNQVLEAP